MAPTMPQYPSKDDPDAIWQYLERGVDRIMTQLREGIDMSSYMGLYSAVHNFCTSQRAVANAQTGLIGSAQHRGGAHLLGEDLYKHLIDYLSTHLKAIYVKSKEHTDEALLTYYIKEWKRFTTAAQYNNHLFKYLNRHWVKREMDEGKKNIYDVYTLHLVQWKEHVFAQTQRSVMDAVLRLVERQRNGETVDYAQIKSIVDCFISLGLDDNESTKSTLEVYKLYFEAPYLESTKQYYQNESKQFLAENSVVEYMKKAEVRLNEEKDHVPLYLIHEIMVPLMKTCNQALIADHAAILRDEFQNLLDNERQEDLGRMYKLLSRIPEGLDPLRTRFENHVRRAGLNAVEKVAADGDALEPKVYVDSLLEVHSQYESLVNRAFKGESEFVRSLDNACKEFVNRNTVCKSGSTRSPELLAKYTDNLLKKTAKSAEESDLEQMLGQIMTVFKYIEDKDVFQKFYSRMLAKRLVQNTSASDDAETSMIGKLKEACGFEYTNKLQRMFQDMQISADLNSSFKTHQAERLDDEDKKTAVDASYHILGTGFWPLTPPATAFAPPADIVKTYERFQHFYLTKHQGRKLTWLWQLCKGEVRANYVKANKVPYTFQVSTYQIAILLLFNDSDNVSYDEMASSTRLNKETLDPSIAIMVKAKVILPEPAEAKTESGTRYTLNYGFKSKKVKVNLNIGIKSEQKAEVEETHKTIEEDRKLLMQSAIVRIMKARKKMKNQLLIQETIAQIKSRFTPNIKDIKKCIDILLEKEYLERLENDEFGYLA